MNQPQVLNFVRLFILHRILKQFITKIEPLPLDDLNCGNKDQKSKASKIVSSLQKYGIKIYMTDHYNEAYDSQIIDLIFDKIIFQHFETQYHQIISCNNSENFLCKLIDKVFNTKVLMCLIFEFAFESTNDINNISLVCSHWFYHAFDTQSYRFFQGITKFGDQEKNKYSLAIITLMKIVSFNPTAHPFHRLETLKSQMQRLRNTQRLTFCATDVNKIAITQKFLSYMSVFTNIEKLDVILFGWTPYAILDPPYTYQDQLKALQIIMVQCKNKIKELKIALYSIGKPPDDSQLPVLKLNNLERLCVDERFFPVVFSNKLESLTIGGLIEVKKCTLSKEWIKFIIDNCDCTNIKNIKIINVEFDKSVFDDAYHKYRWQDWDTFGAQDSNNVNTNVKIINLINNLARKLIHLAKIEFVGKAI